VLGKTEIKQTDGILANSLVASITLTGELKVESVDGVTLNTDEVVSKLKSSGRLNREIAIVWLPTQKIVMTDVMVPGNRKALWMAALPYALEENLSESVEKYHFVPYNRTKEGLVSVAIACHEDMKNWKLIVESYGLAGAQLVPDCFRIASDSPALANGDRSWGVYQRDEAFIVRTDGFHGFASNAAWHDAIKGQILNNQYIANETHSKSATSPTVIEEITVASSELLSSHAQNLIKVSKLSLSQLAYKSSGGAKGNWYQWRWVAVLMVAVFGIFLTTQSIQTQKLQDQTSYTKAKTTELFKTLFPEAKRIVNIKAQTLTHLKQQDSSSPNTQKLMPILQQIEPWFNKVKSVKVEQLQWQQSGKPHALSLNVTAPSSAELQKVISLSQESKQSGLVTTKITLSLKLNNVNAEGAEGVIYVDAN